MNDDRIRFPTGKQTEFINNVILKTGSIPAMAAVLKVSARTIRDWRREKFTMSYEALKTMSRLGKIPMPKNIQHEKKFWYVTKGARQGGLASYKKQGGIIGDPAVRAQNWREWWEKEGKAKPMPANFYPLPFSRPEKSVELAEFMGIAMGDGGMANRQFSISLHHIDDLAYSRFVIALIEKLFSIKPSVKHIEARSVNILLVSRSLLIEYLHELGLPIGNKVEQRFDIPLWIQSNHEYMIACVRGLVDTDGCVFIHRYRVNGKLYSYKKLDFCSYSPPLIATVDTFLKSLAIHTRIAAKVDIRIESKAGIERYMQLIGSHNEKHLKKWESRI